jgi:FtsP/CotA-like multicopper oxidase with cupredoxin domain
MKIRLVNQLPVITDSDHATEPGLEYLALNPTNIHTHGMLVAPSTPTQIDPAYGDYVFVLTFNKANGPVTAGPHLHADVRYDYTDYSIEIPRNHPSGLFWIHPHAHGVSLNQVTAGMAGIITVGSVSDYANIGPGTAIRHLILKDTQILPGRQLQDQEDPDFCTPIPIGGEGARLGACAGQDNTGSGGSDYRGGSWYFTVNGQQYPNLNVRGGGEIWRITNTSGSRTYDLNLWNAAQNRNMLFQIVSIDGVGVDLPSGATTQQISEIAGSKFKPVACPGSSGHNGGSQALCTNRLLMMPSSRVEVFVSYRDSNGNVAVAPNGANAVFRTNEYNTGPVGDSWPSSDLASVQFVANSGPATSQTIQVHGDASKMAAPTALSDDMQGHNHKVAADPTCTALPPGHMRRIYFAAPTTNLDAFGLAYEEIDQRGQVVGTPATDVTPFDPMKPTICLPLGPNNSPRVERWQLVNLAGEDHNFHPHQVKFRVLGKDEISGSVVPSQVMGKGVMLDNVPLQHADGTCGNNPPDDSSNPITDFRRGLCKPNIVTVEIPFTIAGDFVYHCHILEHEDGGMMARIRVRPHQ